MIFGEEIVLAETDCTITTLYDLKVVLMRLTLKPGVDFIIMRDSGTNHASLVVNCNSTKVDMSRIHEIIFEKLL